MPIFLQQVEVFFKVSMRGSLDCCSTSFVIVTFTHEKSENIEIYKNFNVSHPPLKIQYCLGHQFWWVCEICIAWALTHPKFDVSKVVQVVLCQLYLGTFQDF